MGGFGMIKKDQHAPLFFKDGTHELKEEVSIISKYKPQESDTLKAIFLSFRV
jgi:hypothetical protein